VYQKVEVASRWVVILEISDITGLELGMLELDILQVGVEQFMVVAH